MAACATHQSAAPIDQSQEAALYKSRARGDYTPPGPPEDPWGPYIREASGKFDVPERWVREVMRVESGGQLFQNGQLITSYVGAMGLMQVMPETYDELSSRYDLTSDAYDPHNNILAGTAYLREMYDIYGMPGCLAAYNAGPKRLDDYLANLRPLPDETRRYVSMIAPYVMDAYPQNRSPAEQYAMNELPIDIPPGLRYGGHTVQYAQARPAASRYAHLHARFTRFAERERSRSAPRYEEVAELPPPPPPGSHRHGFSFIQPAMAETVPGHGGSGGWAVQVGAYGSEGQAHAAAGVAGERVGAHGTVATLHQGHATLYRARVTGLSRDSALHACHKLSKSHAGCMVLAPNSQS